MGKKRGAPRRGPRVRERVTRSFSPELLNALESVTSNQSDFIEEWMWKHPQLKEWKQTMNEQLKQVAQDALSQAQSEGLSDEDAKWTAVGAVNSEAREQGVIGEELSPEMNAVAQQVVKQVQKGNSR